MPAMSRKALFASLIALAAATGPALASGSGDDGTLAQAGVRSGSGSVVGGGAVTLSGGGDNQSFTFAAPHAPPGRIATLTGGGNDAQVAYQPAASATSDIAQTATGGIRG
jgi:hypothetical protein